MKQGSFFTFEGIDGCGKSTQLTRVADALRAKGTVCLVTREPGGPAISEQIRNILISPENSSMFRESELLLYLAARAQHIRETIKPAVDRGEIVLCDRFEQATFAYQGYARGLDLDFLYSINNFATGGLTPDITFIFDISVETSISRLSKIGKGKDRIESEGPQFFEKVRQGYLDAAASNPEKIKLLNGSMDANELTEMILLMMGKKVYP